MNREIRKSNFGAWGIAVLAVGASLSPAALAQVTASIRMETAEGALLQSDSVTVPAASALSTPAYVHLEQPSAYPYISAGSVTASAVKGRLRTFGGTMPWSIENGLSTEATVVWKDSISVSASGSHLLKFSGKLAWESQEQDLPNNFSTLTGLGLSGQISSGGGTGGVVTVPYTFYALPGSDVDIEYTLASFSASTVTPPRMGFTVADAAWGGIQQVEDTVTGQIISNYSLSSVSGLNYKVAAPIPEPEEIALLGVGLLGLFSSKRFRKAAFDGVRG